MSRYSQSSTTLTVTVTATLRLPTRKKAQNDSGHSSLAPCATIKLATLPTSVRFPANVLDAASASHSKDAFGALPTQPRSSITNGTLLNRLLPTTDSSENLVKPSKCAVWCVNAGRKRVIHAPSIFVTPPTTTNNPA